MTEYRKVTQYQSAKSALRMEARVAKEAYKDDKPAIRQCINDFADWLIKDHNWTGTKYEVWLSNFAASLHP